jgi:hypothetical protein
MTRIVAGAPAAEVSGEAVMSVVEGMGAFRRAGITILAECGIVDPAPGKWYKQQDWVAAFKKIAETIGPSTLNAIGKKIPENAIFPPSIRDIDGALGSLNDAYHMNHRNGEAGDFTFKKTGDRSGTMTSDTPYPCDFDLGVLSATAVRFATPGSFPRVTHDDTAPCRKKGGRSCTFHITW